jgi:hypothetical protein
MGDSLIDYLLYIPLTDIPDGGAWVDVVHATNLPNMISGGASRKDDQLRDFQLMGYYTEGGSLVEQDTGWKLEDVGGGNIYVTDDGSVLPVMPIGVVLRIGRRPAKLCECTDVVSLGNGSYCLKDSPHVHLMDESERVPLNQCTDPQGRLVVGASFESDAPGENPGHWEEELTGKFEETEKALVEKRDAKETD